MRLALPLLALLALAACDTASSLLDPQRVRVSSLSHDPGELVGTWALETVTPSGECTGPDCTRTRPASELGWSEQIVFRADGTATVTTTTDQGVTERTEGYAVSESLAAPRLTIGTREEPFGVDGPQLFLDSRYVDGPLLEYRRR